MLIRPRAYGHCLGMHAGKCVVVASKDEGLGKEWKPVLEIAGGKSEHIGDTPVQD